MTLTEALPQELDQAAKRSLLGILEAPPVDRDTERDLFTGKTLVEFRAEQIARELAAGDVPQLYLPSLEA